MDFASNFLIFSKSLDNIEMIATVVSVVVIILLCLSFGGLFYLYYRYYGKCIDSHVEDSYIKKEVVLENKKYFQKAEDVVNNKENSLEFKKENVQPLTNHIKEKTKHNNWIKYVGNTFLVIMYVVFISFMGLAIYTRASGDLLFVNGSDSCLVIRTGSMETANKENKYLAENNLTNQISAYSLIGIEKITDESDLKLYDIVAFNDDKGNIIVHRIVRIDDVDGVKNYVTRGDANTGSASYEMGLIFEDFIGRYNGFQNFGLGVCIYYLQSGIGMITIALALVLIGFYDVLDIYLGKKISQRKSVIYVVIQNEIEHAILNNKEIHYLDYKKQDETLQSIEIKQDAEAVEETCQQSEAIEQPQVIEEPIVVDDAIEETKAKEYERLSFKERMMNISDDLIDIYNELKSEILSYGVKSRISATGDTFRLHTKAYCKLAVSGKAFKIYLALDPKDYENTTYPVKDVSSKSVYSEIPCMLKVKSKLSIKRAKELIKDCMSKDELKQKEVVLINHYEQLKNSYEESSQDDGE